VRRAVIDERATAAVVELNLSYNLLASWGAVEGIVDRLPSLKTLVLKSVSLSMSQDSTDPIILQLKSIRETARSRYVSWGRQTQAT
jgi:hypothetical protein